MIDIGLISFFGFFYCCKFRNIEKIYKENVFYDCFDVVKIRLYGNYFM